MTKVALFLIFFYDFGWFLCYNNSFQKMFLAETYPIEDKKGNDEEIL